MFHGFSRVYLFRVLPRRGFLFLLYFLDYRCLFGTVFGEGLGKDLFSEFFYQGVLLGNLLLKEDSFFSNLPLVSVLKKGHSFSPSCPQSRQV